MLVDANAPPQTPRDRLEVLGRMVAIAQHCSSGDTTELAAARAVAEAASGAGLPPGVLDEMAEVGSTRKSTLGVIPSSRGSLP